MKARKNGYAFGLPTIQRHAPETVDARRISLKNLLRLPAEVVTMPSQPRQDPRHAESFYYAFVNSPSAWEWDMTTPNTPLYRSGR
jgi:hypothetical protein